MGQSVGLGVVGLMVRIHWNCEVGSKELRVHLKAHLHGFVAVVRLNDLR